MRLVRPGGDRELRQRLKLRSDHHVHHVRRDHRVHRVCRVRRVYRVCRVCNVHRVHGSHHVSRLHRLPRCRRDFQHLRSRYCLRRVVMHLTDALSVERLGGSRGRPNTPHDLVRHFVLPLVTSGKRLSPSSRLSFDGSDFHVVDPQPVVDVLIHTLEIADHLGALGVSTLGEALI